MEIFPAIDLRGGCAVRLTMGDYDRMDVFSDSPVEVAAGFAADGSKNLHLVDLDGAKDGTLSNFDVIRDIVTATDFFVQVGGGIRTMERIETYLELGVSRCILGTSAFENPDFLREAVLMFGDKIAVGVDTKNGLVAVSGWLETTDKRGTDFCRELRDIGVSAVIYTDIAKDGMLLGPNHEVYAELAEIDGLNIIASGGVTTLNDLKRLANTGIHGAIIGKALYLGKINLKDALEK